jgi:hypothetical protein
VLANFLEANQFLAVKLMLWNKISIAQPLAFQAQARAQALAQALALCAQALVLRAHALAFYAQDLALYLEIILFLK